MWITFSSLIIYNLRLLPQLFSKTEGIEIELDLAIGKTCQSRKPPWLQSLEPWLQVYQVAMHLVGSKLHEFIALLAWFHRLQLFENLEEHGTIVAHRNVLHRIWHGLQLGGHLHSIRSHQKG